MTTTTNRFLRLRLAIVMLAACSGTDGTLVVGLTTAPGSTIMDGVQTLDVTLTNPPEVHTVTRDANGFALDLAASASDAGRTMRIDGKDANGAIVAAGASPSFPVSAINAEIRIYMAAPMSIDVAPTPLGSARGEIGVAPLTFGAIFVGGRDGAGAVSAAIELYNAYDHTIALGLSLAVPRTQAMVATTHLNNAYIFGGIANAGGAPTGLLTLFNSSVAPSGAFIELGDHPELARLGAIGVATAVDQFTVSGSPVVEISGSSIAPRTDVATLSATGASLIAGDGTLTAMFTGEGAGDTGLVRFRGDLADQPAGGDPAVTSAAATAVGTRAIVIAGGDRNSVVTDELIELDPITAARTVHHLATARTRAAIAATDRFVVVAGGFDGAAVVGDAEIFDAATLAPIATRALVVPRTGASAIALATGQVLIVGGTDATGAPTAVIELFTPPN